MTDNPLKKLEDAMAAPPAPRRKSAAAEAAMRAFDEEFSETSQGTAECAASNLSDNQTEELDYDCTFIREQSP